MLAGEMHSEFSPTQRSRMWRFLQFLFRGICCTYLQYRARGVERMPAGGALLVANHQSYLDPLLICVPLNRPISFLARDSLFRAPIVGWILKNTLVLPVNQAAPTTVSIRAMIDRIKAGFYVGMFPEGTRTPDGKMCEIKPGMLAIVKRIDAPICPIGIAGGYESYPMHAAWPRPAKIRVVFGPPIPANELVERWKRDGEEATLKFLGERIGECVEEAYRWRNEGAAPKRAT